MTDARPDGLLAELKDELLWLGRIFGQPSALRRALPIAHWRRLRAWLRALERIAARLVRALAETLDETAPVRVPSSGRSPREQAGAPNTDHPESECWTGVRLRLDADRTRPSRATPRAAPFAPAAARAPDPYFRPGFRSGGGLALRLEALIRIAENPMRCARRRARALARRAAPSRPPLRQPPPTHGEARIRALGPPLRPPVLGTG